MHALDSSVWSALDELPSRAEAFLLGLVSHRILDLFDVPILDHPWPLTVDPVDVEWPVRVRNVFGRAGLMNANALDQMTYGQLWGLPAIGVKSVLDFAVMAEAIAVKPPEDLPSETSRWELRSAADEEWADKIRADDPRFREFVPPYDGTLSDLFEDSLVSPHSIRALMVSQSLDSIRKRAEMIASDTLERAISALLVSLGARERDIVIFFERFGLGTGETRTLQQIADNFSITRERVRQVVSKWTVKMRGCHIPQIETALQILEEYGPVAASEVSSILSAHGLSDGPINPKGLAALATSIGHEPGFRTAKDHGVEFVIPKESAGTAAVFSVARRQAGRVGVSNLEEVAAELAMTHDYSAQDVSRVLTSTPDIEFLDSNWFWMPAIPSARNRLRNVTQKMLCVSSPMDLVTVRQGIRRRYRWRQIDIVPPIEILKLFFIAHPEFTLEGAGRVCSSHQLDCSELLGETERILVKVLRASPTGLLDRTEFEEAATAGGVNGNTFSVFTSYSEIIDHPATNIWCLRGTVTDPTQVEALRAITARPREKRTLDYAWEADGRLRLTVRLGNVGSPVVYVPSSILKYVADRRFAARTREGADAGIIAVDDSGASWGYGPFLRRRGAEPDDVLTLRFDLVDESIALTLEDGDLLMDADDWEDPVPTYDSDRFP